MRVAYPGSRTTKIPKAVAKATIGKSRRRPPGHQRATRPVIVRLALLCASTLAQAGHALCR